MTSNNNTYNEEIQRQHGQFSSIRILLPSNKRLVAAEKGSVAYYSMLLTSKPRHNVEIEVIHDDGLVTIHPSKIIFTPENFDVIQKVSIQTVISMNSTTTNADVVLKHIAYSKDYRYKSPKCIITPSMLLVAVVDCDAPHLFSFGNGANGELGIGEVVNVQHEPTHVDFKYAVNLPSKVKQRYRKGDQSPRKEWVRKFYSPKPKKGILSNPLLIHTLRSTEPTMERKY